MNEHEAYLHRRAWDAIPWVVAGAASAEERNFVEEHLPRCTQCQAELALQQRVHSGMHASTPSASASSRAAAESGKRAGWYRLARRLGGAEGVATALRPAAATPAWPMSGSTRPEAGTRPGQARAVAGMSPLWARWLVAAVVVQAVALGATGLALLDRARERGADVRTPSQPPAAPAAARVRVVPAPGLDFAALRQLLAQTRMVAVGVGPDGSSLGLAAADADPRTVAAALPVLRASPLLMLAEPVLAEAVNGSR